ncbi:MAG TPA: hypothetical protein VH280_04960 [Verrucomicrobiae bacterium]|nr:hypothetical protein [Verrucomicrobiae bacterium]
MNNLRQMVIDEAKTWVGTKFHHEARVKGHGVDCGQMLIAVYGKFGFMPEDYKLEHYPADFAMHRDREWYLEIVQEFAKEVDKPGPGDVVLFKWGRLYSHGGVVVDWPNIIHAWAPAECVTPFNAEFNPLAAKPRRFFSPFDPD